MNEAPAKKGPLDGIRVIDMTAVVLGPLATQILGDYGADVIKVEGPEGDMMRPGATQRPGHTDMGAIYLAINRNKRSVVLDLKTPEGLAAIKRLIATADVFVHNIRVKPIERLGLGYEAVRAINPRIIYCAATGYGQDGPMKDAPAFDDVIQAASGLACLFARRPGMEGAPPAYVPSLIADKTAGLCVVNSVLAALFARERTGIAQYVEVPMFESITSYVMAEHMMSMTFEGAKGRGGYNRILAPHRNPAKTLDGYIALLPYTRGQWRAFFKEAGRDDMAEDPRINNAGLRAKNIGDIYAIMAGEIAKRSTADWLAICARADVPAFAVSELENLPEHPHLKAVKLFQTMEHPTEGEVHYVRPPTIFSETPASVRRHAPNLGEHTDEVLAEVGMDSAEIAALRGKGVLGRRQQGS